MTSFAHYFPIALGVPNAITMPSFVAAGAGAVHAVTQNVLQVPMPAGIAAGDVILMQLWSRTNGILPAAIDGWQVLEADYGGGSRDAIVLYRVVADATAEATQTILLSGTPNCVMGRTYAWRGIGDISTIANQTNAASSSNAFVMPSITTSNSNRIAIFFGAADDDIAIAASTGESGGDWVEPTGEFRTSVGNNSTIFCQTADLASATTISGGSVSLGAGTDGFRLSFTIRGTSGVPSFVAAGAGVTQSVVATLTAALPAGIAIGDILVTQFGSRSAGVLPTAISGWTAVALDTFDASTKEHYLFARAYTGSGADLVIGLTGTVDVAIARMYAFRSCAGIAQTEDSASAEDSGGTLAAPTLGPTDQANELGVSFLFFDDDDAVPPYSGASGGTWTEAVAEFTTTTGNDGCLQCQTVPIPNLGTTISGGSLTPGSGDHVGARSWSYRGLAA
jgi:hypothetical protein